MTLNLSCDIEWTSTPRRPLERPGFRALFGYTCRMRIVTYRDLRPGRFVKPLERLRAALARGDFAAAGLKKLAPTPYWRAKLSDEARLLVQFAPYNGETVCLFLEVIADHAYEKFRFLRGAPDDRDKIEAGPDDLTPQPEPSAGPGLGAQVAAAGGRGIRSHRQADHSRRRPGGGAPPCAAARHHRPRGLGQDGRDPRQDARGDCKRSICDALGLSGADGAPALRRAWLRKFSSGRRIHELSRARRFDRRPRGRGGPLRRLSRLVRAPAGRPERRLAAGRRACAVRGIPRRARGA